MTDLVPPAYNAASPFADMRGHHVAVRAPDYETVKRWYVEPAPRDVRPYADLGESLVYAGYHHFCLEVASIDVTLEKLRERGVTIVAGPFLVEAISRRLAFFADPFGNLIEIAEVVA